MVSIVQATKKSVFLDAQNLLREYGQLRNRDAALGDFDKELQNLPGRYGPPGGVLLIAHVDNEPAGCVAFRQTGEGICEMKRLYVKEKFRGLHIGRKLVAQIIEEAQKMNYRVMQLDTHPWMQHAQTVYQQFGFQEIEAYHYNPTEGIRYFELEL